MMQIPKLPPAVIPPSNSPAKPQTTFASLIGKSASSGWTLPTGTLSRATFDQSTVTLPQLAQRVAALITDLYGAGVLTT